MKLFRGTHLALLAACASGEASANDAPGDVGFEWLYNQTTPEEFENRCVQLNAPLPEWAQGDFIISSIGVLEMGPRRFRGVLDGFGKMQRFELRDQKVCATYRIMTTEFYKQCQQANDIVPEVLFYETDPPRHCPLLNPFCNMGGPQDNMFVNTIKHGDRILSLTDAPDVLSVDPKSLQVDGKFQWSDGIQSKQSFVGSAHPVRAKDGSYVAFVGTPQLPLMGSTKMTFFRIREDSPSERIVFNEFQMNNVPYFHSFGLTDRFVVLPRMPIHQDVMKVMTTTAHELFVDTPLSKEGPDNAFFLVPLDGSSPIMRTLPLSQKLYYLHVINTYETDSAVVIDMSCFNANPYGNELWTLEGISDKASRDSEADRTVVMRYTIPLDESQAISWEGLSDPQVSSEFPKMNPNYSGRKHCYYWTTQWFTNHRSYGSMAVVKYDVCTGQQKVEWQRPNWFPSEPQMIPSQEPGAAEDEGLIVFTALNGERGETSLIMLDARTLEVQSEAGPYPRIAFTTHGQFYPAGSWQHAEMV